jgi:hypothetical protein
MVLTKKSTMLPYSMTSTIPPACNLVCNRVTIYPGIPHPLVIWMPLTVGSNSLQITNRSVGVPVHVRDSVRLILLTVMDLSNFIYSRTIRCRYHTFSYEFKSGFLAITAMCESVCVFSVRLRFGSDPPKWGLAA